MQLDALNAVFVSTLGVQLRKAEQIRGALAQLLTPKLPTKYTIRCVYHAHETALIVSEWTIAGTGRDGKPVEMAGTGADG